MLLGPYCDGLCVHRASLARAIIIITALMLYCAASAAAQSADSTTSACQSVAGSEVITREEIGNAALARLSDVFRLADRWHTATIDGYTFDAQAAGLSMLSNPRWTVLVDNAPFEIGLFGTQSLNVLPIHINEVECIELIARPHVAAGELRQFGAIHIHTRRPAEGMTLGASVAAGNEVNDPGPFAYTPLASENIDRIGPIGAGIIEIRSKGRFARLSGKLDEFHVTDQQVDFRARQLYNADSKPRIYTSAIALTTGWNTHWGAQRIVAGRTETGDLLFFETFGIEIPSMRRLDVLATSGSLRLASGELRYRGSYLSHELFERQNAGGINLDFRQQVWSGGLESHLVSGPIRMTIGGSVDMTEGQTRQELTDNRSLTTRLFSLAEFSRGRLHASLFGSWIHSEDRSATSVMPAIRVVLPDDRRLAASASFTRRTLMMDATLWRWTHLGYNLPEFIREDDDDLLPGRTSGVATDLREAPATKLFTADLEFGGSMPQGVDYLVGAYYRRSHADYLAHHDITYDEHTTGFLTQTTIVDQISGEIAGVHAGLGLNLVPGFSQRIAYVAESRASSDSLFESAHARVPAQRFSVTATFAPNDRFSVYARARYEPATVWNEYEAAARASEGFYVWELPERVLVDLAATKRLWRDHLIATLSIRNLLNEPYIAHPAGAVTNMSFHFTLRASINSEAGL